MITRDRTSAVPVSSPKGFSPRFRTVKENTQKGLLRNVDIMLITTENIEFQHTTHENFDNKRDGLSLKKESKTHVRKVLHLLVF